jgi:hypothetical protein
MRIAIQAERSSSSIDRRELIELPDGTTFSAAGKVGMAMLCIRGTVWVTQTGMPGDVVLAAGETFTAMHRGKLVALAIADAVLEVRS